MSDILKVCPKCNTDISTETGECFYCSPNFSTDSKSNGEIRLSNRNDKNADKTIRVVCFLLLCLPISVFQTQWLLALIHNIFPWFKTKHFVGIGFGIFVISYFTSFFISFLIWALFLELLKNPKGAIKDFCQLITDGIPKLFEFCISMIAFGFFSIIRIAFFIFLFLFGLALIIFMLKFIKSQIFS